MKRGWIIGIVVLIVVLLVAIGIYVFSGKEKAPASCGKLGEQVSEVYRDEYPEKCCAGLTAWGSGMDTRVSVETQCYETGKVSGSPVSTCINCGNGVCEDSEDVCNCPDDCTNGENSDYTTLQSFCAAYGQFCGVNHPEAKDLPLCKRC